MPCALTALPLCAARPHSKPRFCAGSTPTAVPRTICGRSLSRKPKAKAIRQSVTIPGPLAVQVRRVAKERQLTMSRALITLAERGIREELDAKENLKAAY